VFRSSRLNESIGSEVSRTCPSLGSPVAGARPVFGHPGPEECRRSAEIACSARHYLGFRHSSGKNSAPFGGGFGSLARFWGVLRGVFAPRLPGSRSAVSFRATKGRRSAEIACSGRHYLGFRHSPGDDSAPLAGVSALLPDFGPFCVVYSRLGSPVAGARRVFGHPRAGECRNRLQCPPLGRVSAQLRR
jgi:hypothetical protein